MADRMAIVWMMKISYIQKVTNTDVMEKVGAKVKWADELAQRKMKFAGHILRGSNGKLSQLVLEGVIEGKCDRGRRRRTWGLDLKEWSNSQNLGEVKRKAEDRQVWRNMVANLRTGEEEENLRKTEVFILKFN